MQSLNMSVEALSLRLPLLRYLQDYNGSVVKVYGPPLDPQFFPRLEESQVPQPPYICGTNQKNWEQKPSIYFLTRGSPGVMLPDAARGRVEDMDDKDSFPLDVDRGGITIRIHASFQFHQSLAI